MDMEPTKFPTPLVTCEGKLSIDHIINDHICHHQTDFSLSVKTFICVSPLQKIVVFKNI